MNQGEAWNRMTEGIGEGISKLHLSKDERNSDVTAITHGMSKISTRIKEEEVGLSDKSPPIKDAVGELIKIQPEIIVKNVTRVEILLQPVAVSWKMNKEAYPKFQGGEASSRFFYTWSGLNFWQLIQDRRLVLDRDYFFPEYNFNVHVRLSKGWEGYLTLALRFIKKIIEKDETSATKKSHKETKTVVDETVECKPLVPCIYVVMKVSKCPHLIRSIQCNYGEAYLYDKTYYNSIHYGKLEQSLGKSNGITELDIYVEQPSMSTRSYSSSGVLVWSVDDYERSKEKQKNEWSEGELSPYFYTDPRGYRVQAVVILDRTVRQLGKDVSVEINFLNGLYDDWLVDYYEHRTTVSVVKKNSPTVKLSKSVEKNLKDESSYVIELGNYEEVEQCIEMDTLCYTVIIEGLATGKKRKRDATTEESQITQNDAARKKK